MNADTRGMRIVHTALRRDLARAQEVLGAAEPRWIILNVLSRGYRQRAFRCWWDAEHSPRKLRPGGFVSVVTAASPSRCGRC